MAIVGRGVFDASWQADEVMRLVGDKTLRGVSVDLATAAKQQPVVDPRVYLRRAHVGYYLIDRGFEDLKPHIGYHPRFIDRIRTALHRNADDFFIHSQKLVVIDQSGHIRGYYDGETAEGGSEALAAAKKLARQ